MTATVKLLSAALLLSLVGGGAYAEARNAVHKEAPVYPRGAERRGIEGHVVLAFTVKADGSVADAKIVEGTPPGVFDEAALQAVSKWKYEAAGADTPGVNLKLTFKQ